MTPADGEFGSKSKGGWTGLIGDVLSGRAHVVVAYLSQTYSRAQVIDYSSVLIKFRSALHLEEMWFLLSLLL